MYTLYGLINLIISDMIQLLSNTSKFMFRIRLKACKRVICIELTSTWSMFNMSWCVSMGFWTQTLSIEIILNCIPGVCVSNHAWFKSIEQRVDPHLRINGKFLSSLFLYRTSFWRVCSLKSNKWLLKLCNIYVMECYDASNTKLDNEVWELTDFSWSCKFSLKSVS